MKQDTLDKIRSIITRCVDNSISRVSKDQVHRPFHEALLTADLVKASAFERSFSTSFGQGPVEEMTYLVALDAGHECKRQKETMVNVFKGAIDEIDRIASALRSGEKKPNWANEIKKVCAYNKGDSEVRRVISDIWIKAEDEIFISIKTVKPNLDQTEIAKRDMLLLKAHNPDYQPFFGLFYNPGGENKQDYNWKLPFKIFDMHKDPCVLIGREYWDKIAGSGTYNELLQLFLEVGEDTRNKLSKLKG